MAKFGKGMRMAVAVCSAAVLALALVACGNSKDEKESSGSSQASSSSQAASEPAYRQTAEGEYASGTHHATVKVKGYDAFTIELDADDAPVTVANFCELANDGFYEGVGFHRIVEGFCLQGGDPTGTGAGGSDSEILGEFSENGVDNKLADAFEKGTVAMARSTLPNSASSQFFITLDSSDDVSLSLNGKYAAFGTVDKEGMKTVDKIVKDYLPAAEAGGGVIAEKADMPVIESIKITD